MLPRILPLILALNATLACSSNDSSDPETAHSAAAVKYCDGTVGLSAQALETKCSSANKATLTWGVSQVFILSIVDSCKDELSKSIESGRAVLDEAAVDACIAGHQAVYDSSPALEAPDGADRWGPDCDKAIVGQQPVGAVCSWNYECQSPATCVGHTTEADGTCQTPALGETCDVLGGVSFFESTVHPACASDAYCGSGDLCAAKNAAGESCDYDEACVDGLRCHLGVCGTDEPIGTGGACLGDEDCTDSHYCAPAHTCQPSKSAGAPCSESAECDGICEGTVCQAFCGSS
jgi:hypothetical protein